MKHKLTAFVLLLAIAGSSFNKIIVLLDFKLNEDFIAANLCENRDKPSCCCHGKCYLKKKLQKEEDGSKTGSGESRSKFDINLFLDLTQEFYPVCCDQGRFDEANTPSVHSIFLSSVFHPPGRA